MKAPEAFRTISEVAEELELPQHVLRFWETRFPQIKPMKRGGGRRYYRPEDVDLLRGIRLLLYGQGFTIRGVQRLLKDNGVSFVVEVGQTGAVQTVTAADREDMEQEEAPAPRARIRREPSRDVAVEPRGSAVRSSPEAASLTPPAMIASLSEDKRRRLEAALAELIEAKELLEQAL
jgi:DNA-binding transcriptional MerR regulator